MIAPLSELQSDPVITLDRLDRSIALMERCTDLLERLGGLNDEDRDLVRKAVLAGLTTQVIVSPKVVAGYKPYSSLPLQQEQPTAEPAPVLVSDLSQASGQSQAAADSTDRVAQNLPRFPRFGEVWMALYGVEPSPSQAISCGRFLSAAYRRDFRSKAPRTSRLIGGSYKQFPRYKREWMVERVREFAAQEGA